MAAFEIDATDFHRLEETHGDLAITYAMLHGANFIEDGSERNLARFTVRGFEHDIGRWYNTRRAALAFCQYMKIELPGGANSPPAPLAG